MADKPRGGRSSGRLPAAGGAECGLFTDDFRGAEVGGDDDGPVGGASQDSAEWDRYESADLLRRTRVFWQLNGDDAAGAAL